MDVAADRAAAGESPRLGKRVFTFAVVADTHVNQEEGKASSDFAVNRLSNARNRYVIHEINRAAPAFVLHLGDIVHPTPIHPGYATAAASFHALAKELRCPLYLTPGNHDVGDKPGDWLPVPSVNDDFLAMYQRHFGRHFYSFDSNDCHFVVINAQIINSGLQCEHDQRRWLEEDLAAHSSQRNFMCTHYPPYLYDSAEEGHYDNIDEPGRSWLLGLLARHKIEAVFAGHVHNFWYHLHAETEIYLLPSTAFVRLDYSELFRIGPAPERGRNDAPKLGFFVVDVHERGHVAHAIRTFGAELAPGATLDRSAERVAPIHTKTIARAPVGIDLRYPWAEKIEVAASGALDEFSRKAARNDYPLMSLWEMGIRRLRVPVGDLAHPDTRERMRVLKRIGHEFTVYTHGIPSGPLWTVFLANLHLVDAWEIIAARHRLDQLVAPILSVKSAASIEVYLSRLQRHDDTNHHRDRARHVIQHGFSLDEGEEIRTLFEREQARAAFDGVRFTVGRDRSPWDDIREIAELARAIGISGHAYVRLAADSPSVATEDDLANANRVAETVLAAFGQSNVGVLLDTFNDVDRGYFPRTGLVDRRYNPRMAGKVCRNLHGAFSALPPSVSGGRVFSASGARALALECRREHWFAILPERAVTIDSLPMSRKLDAVTGSGKCIDLVSGAINQVGWTVGGCGGEPAARFDHPVACCTPVLFCITE